jgi:glycosyltransferase involved in cell wall biosynthesis
MTQKISISIIIATFNSEKTLRLCLASIQRQTYPQNNIEILVVDGGSTDKTKTIARKNNCIVLHNKKVAPAFAKHMGFFKAKGKYILYFDSDEVMESPESIALKLRTFEQNKNVKAVISTGYEKPSGYPFVCNYINEFGDPFSYFIYRISKDSRFFLKEMLEKYKVLKNDSKYVTFDLSKVKVLPIIELVAMATMIDAEYFKKRFPELITNEALIPHMFYMLNKDRKQIAIMKHDVIVHYSADTFRKYLNKIKSRIKNNIFNTSSGAIEGFTGREQYLPPTYRFKKYLFLPYTFSLVFLLYDSVCLSITRRNIFYFIHIYLCFYTSLVILQQYCLKLLGVKPQLKSYGEATVVDLK